MLLKLVWKKILFKKLNSFLCILLMGLGVAIISLIGNISKQLEESFTKSISGIDMVIGAKGSPMQLILSSVFHLDSPTGNINLEDVEKLKNNRLVKTIIPLSFGDNYKGYRIIGTNSEFLIHYKATLESGKLAAGAMEVVLGNEIAKSLKMNIGDKFRSSHGLDAEGEKHDEDYYKVVGLLNANNSVIDNLIICDLRSIWNIHQHVSKKLEITSALVKFKSPMGLMTLPKAINENTKMQAALPAIEVNRLFKLFGKGVELLKYLAFLIVFISGISVFITLYNSLKEQKNEKAIMLTLGAKREEIFFQLLLEGILLSFFGYIFGILVAKIALSIFININRFPNLAELKVWQFEPSEIYLLIMALFIGILSAVLPALGIYKINISKTLSRD